MRRIRNRFNVPSPQHLQGSAVTADREGTADPSIDMLASRMKQLESLQRLQAMEITAVKQQNGDMAALVQQALNEKRIAEEGLRAAREEIMRLREARPITTEDRRMMMQAVQQEARSNAQIKHERFRDALKSSPMVDLVNPGRAVRLQLNGHVIIVHSGLNKIPKLFMAAWEANVESAREAARRNVILADQQVEFNFLENWRAETVVDLTQFPTTHATVVEQKTWDEHAGAA